ncbi:glycosyl hydrolase 43 family protein [Parapedobacter sp. SGR-10]|uniref:glycoside hydrolase family 43 protein n=1 Tax=Parapedobacter sp. SGR-10 TaxID=2710879 RepID=UPI0013D1E0B3|nr:glycoside hydrolase 43 family protein [Parapedobacter sp. SGR-10]NGF56938.1 glycosyl hydrolase 43 family protein [Parapedobacter sp. SGR-10]
MKYFIILYGVLLYACVGQTQEQTQILLLETPKTGTWGDQGDGTFRNPVLNSNYPDSDVEKWGDKWYMISSKGRYMKGMTILESEDLVNWSILGGIVDSVDWYDADEKDGEGVWAGDLVRHGDRWLCYFIDIDKGLFVCTSTDIEGRWSAPQLILERKGMTDPAVYFDDDTQEGYLICNYKIEDVHNEKRLYYNRLFRLSWDGMKVLDKGQDIYVESGAEAAKIYRINSYFYLFFSEWTTNGQGKKVDRRQIVLRSKHIAGPYEKKILLERDPVTGRSSSQGSLVQAPDSSWWYFHQLVQKPNTFEGRPQCLIPVTWQDDWPLLGTDPDGNGIGNTVWRNRKPITGKPIRSPQTDDDFRARTLGVQWLWDGNPVNHLWTLEESPGNMRMYGARPRDENRPYESLPNKLLQRKMGTGKDTVTTKMDVSGMQTGQSAGLIVTGFNHAVIGVHYHPSKEKRIYVERADGKIVEVPLDGTKQSVYLRAVMDERNLDLMYSLDGVNYHSIGETYLLQTRGFNGLFIGFYSMSAEDNVPKNGYVDFDWFTYSYDGPKNMQLMEIK